MVVTTLASGRWQGSSQMTSAVQLEFSVASDVNCQVMHPEALTTSSIWLQMSTPWRSNPVYTPSGSPTAASDNHMKRVSPAPRAQRLK